MPSVLSTLIPWPRPGHSGGRPLDYFPQEAADRIVPPGKPVFAEGCEPDTGPFGLAPPPLERTPSPLKSIADLSGGDYGMAFVS